MSRKQLPKAIETDLLTRSKRICALCFGLENITNPCSGQIAHLDKDPNNNAINNLCWLCFDHHDNYDSRTSQSKNFTIGEVTKYRENLYNHNTNAQTIAPQEIITISKHDSSILFRINTMLPYDTLTQIENEPFGSFVRMHIIEPMDNFRYNTEDPLFSFDNKSLENLKLLAVDKVHTFFRHFGAQSGGTPAGYDYININEFKRMDPNTDVEYWLNYSHKTHVYAKDFCEAINALRKESRNY